MKPELNAYFEGLEESEVRSLAEVIAFNEKHADLELPPRMYTTRFFFGTCTADRPKDHPRQDNFINSENQQLSTEEYDRHLSYLRHMGREKGVDLALKTYGVDVILGPVDSGLTSLATASGKSSRSELIWESGNQKSVLLTYSFFQATLSVQCRCHTWIIMAAHLGLQPLQENTKSISWSRL